MRKTDDGNGVAKWWARALVGAQVVDLDYSATGSTQSFNADSEMKLQDTWVEIQVPSWYVSSTRRRGVGTAGSGRGSTSAAARANGGLLFTVLAAFAVAAALR